MPFVKVPVNVPFWSNAEDASKVVVAEQRRDVMKDAVGSTIRRPGLTSFVTGLPAKVNGMFYWEKQDLVYFESDKDLYSLDQDGNETLIDSDFFDDTSNISWADSTNTELVTTGAIRRLFAASGGRLSVYDGATAFRLTGVNDPVKATHVIIFDTYALSNERTSEQYDESILYSEVANPISFVGEFFSAENRPDKINALHANWDEIALFGSRSIENFYDDGETPFAQIPGGAVATGTLAPWSIQFADNAYFFLDTKRRIVRLDGRQPTILSYPVDDILAESTNISLVEGAEGDILTLNGKTLYLITIAGRTLVYDYALREWVGEWGEWDKTSAMYKAFKARKFLNVEQWGVTLCADKSTGDIYKIDFDSYQDDGEEIRSSVITGNIDHGTSREKRSKELKLKIRRGDMAKVSLSDVEPVLIVRWRDNGSQVWSNDRQIPLGFQGDNEFYHSIYQLGTYRSRQYEFYCTENIPIAIVEVEEDVELQR